MNPKITAPLSLLRVMGLMLMTLGLIMASSVVFAQATDVLQPYRDFKPSEDMATRLMEGLLGATYTSPFTAGIQSNTLFGAIFLVFNIIVFAVGTVFASYGVVAGIVQTAHEGVVMGKRMSAVWMPIRMVTGIGGLIPAFGGFSLSQVAMIVATSWGISFGNFAYDAALTAASTTSTLVNASFSRTDSTKDANAMAQALFAQRLCQIVADRKVKEIRAQDNEPTKDQILIQIPIAKAIGDPKGGALIGSAIGTADKPSQCFAVAIQRKPSVFSDAEASAPGIVGGLKSAANSVRQWGGLGADTGRQGTSMFGFRSGAVDYAAINRQVWAGYKSGFPTFVSNIRKLADEYEAAVRVGTEKVPYPVQEIRAEGVRFVGSVIAPDVNHQNVTKEALENMRKRGFFSAGAYYSTHAEVNAAVMQASDVVEFLVDGPDNRKVLASGDYDFTYGSPEESVGAVGSGSSTAKRSWCLVDTNDTGNCSFGQRLVSKVMEAGTAGSGGSSTMIDPIIALKNIGDYMMVLGEGILAAVLYSGEKPGISGAAADVLSSVPGVGGMISGIIKGIGAMAPYIGGLLFAVGALCAIYIPMVPFINWVSGLVQYCCIVVESFAAAPLWAFAHLQADGEGMGQRTERGYLYLLNLLFRPILMIVGFFAASALVILLGSLIFQMFAPAMAAAQGNSVTGIFSAIGYVFLFFVIMNIIISGLFDLVSQLPDDVIGWVGGVGNQKIGKDAESKISGMFVAGGRFGATGVDRAATALGGGDKKKAVPAPTSGGISKG